MGGGAFHLRAGGAELPGMGRGGIDRGPGEAPMFWGDESEGGRFKSKQLPRGLAQDPENSTLLGIGKKAPGVDAQGEAAGGGSVETSEGQTAWRRRLAPRHRRAVGTFFSRDGR